MRGARSAVRASAGCGVFDPQAKARVMMTAASGLLILDLDDVLLRVGTAVARDEIVFLRVVAERAERHAQQFRGLRLNSTAAFERLEHEDFPDRLQMILERDPV